MSKQLKHSKQGEHDAKVRKILGKPIVFYFFYKKPGGCESLSGLRNEPGQWQVP